jgi:hypothetical protein
MYGGELFSRFTPQKHFSAYCAHFFSRISNPQGLLRPEELGIFMGIVHVIVSVTSGLPACSIAPIPLHHHVPTSLSVSVLKLSLHCTQDPCTAKLISPERISVEPEILTE